MKNCYISQNGLCSIKMQLVDGNNKLRISMEIILGVKFHSEAWLSFVSKKMRCTVMIYTEIYQGCLDGMNVNLMKIFH